MPGTPRALNICELLLLAVAVTDPDVFLAQPGAAGKGMPSTVCRGCREVLGGPGCQTSDSHFTFPPWLALLHSAQLPRRTEGHQQLIF